eukprot:CAMPEP_0118896436 /NCGR_PEP_ID=MMETSP1166-20130328/4302_1 /TAXON_ID=1104430 /ORGANISM="Chrysoreinhardia sp, Strain CCMP3193" /LENGTH=219 /DNA_ID=CAMNT_0006835493 /DNA_START=78 /DNA_END=737 /DNA_ORIENTATION=+
MRAERWLMIVAAAAAVARHAAAEEAEKRMKDHAVQNKPVLEAALEQGPLMKKMDELLESFGNLQTGAATTGGFDPFAIKDDVSKIIKEEFKLANVAIKDDLAKFATKDEIKDDLAKFATKDDLAKFATKDDLAKFATKDDLAKFATKYSRKVANLDDTLTRINNEYQYQKGQEAAGKQVAGFFRGVVGPFFAAVARFFRDQEGENQIDQGCESHETCDV